MTLPPNTANPHKIAFYFPRNTNLMAKWVIQYHYDEVYELLKTYYASHFTNNQPPFEHVKYIQFKEGISKPIFSQRKTRMAPSGASTASVPTTKSETLYIPASFLGKGILDELMLNHIENDVYTRLSMREIALADGRKTYIVGVYAIRDIPAGINPFKTLLGDCFGENPVVYLPNDHLRLQETRSFLSEFFIGDAKNFALPILGPNSISVVYFMNHSNTPNMTMEETDECQYKIYKTKTVIKTGEELVIDYREFVSHKNGLPFEALQAQLDPTNSYLSAPKKQKTATRTAP
jgi:hypothetical protein